MKTLTIFTPTFNRANLLPRLYNSLKNQTNQNFVWMIINDGSSDNTDEVVKSFLEENFLEKLHKLALFSFFYIFYLELSSNYKLTE